MQIFKLKYQVQSNFISYGTQELHPVIPFVYDPGRVIQNTRVINIRWHHFKRGVNECDTRWWGWQHCTETITATASQLTGFWTQMFVADVLGTSLITSNGSYRMSCLATLYAFYIYIYWEIELLLLLMDNKNHATKSAIQIRNNSAIISLIDSVATYVGHRYRGHFY